jgi:hypothetical protein
MPNKKVIRSTVVNTYEFKCPCGKFKFECSTKKLLHMKIKAHGKFCDMVNEHDLQVDNVKVDPSLNMYQLPDRLIRDLELNGIRNADFR